MDMTKVVEARLNTIRAVIPSTIAIYQNSEDLKAIQPNINMMKTALEALSDMAEEQGNKDILDELDFTCGQELDIDTGVRTNGDIVVCITGLDVEARVDNVELFGDVTNAIDVTLSIPIICGRTYKVRQVNSMLQLFDTDPSISQDTDGNWVKEKEYLITDEDVLEYSFLVGNGRNVIAIEVEGADGTQTFEIVTHVHFKK